MRNLSGTVESDGRGREIYYSTESVGQYSLEDDRCGTSSAATGKEEEHHYQVE
jgi:hypothetical protein